MRRRRNQRRAWGRVADARDVLADFLGGQLAALTGLGALGHFDFELFSVDEIICRDTKTRRGNLLDFVGSGRLIAIRVGIFTAFTSIAAATKLVHGQRQGAVRFRTERAKRHRLSAEALDDGLKGLDLIESDGGIGNGIEQVAKKDGALM